MNAITPNIEWSRPVRLAMLLCAFGTSLAAAQEPPAQKPAPPSDRVEVPIESVAGMIPVAKTLPRDVTDAPIGPPADWAEPPTPRDIPTYLPFGEGEHLRFSVDYGIINAGGATMTIEGTRRVMGVDCLHIRTEAKSNRFFSQFYKVWDRAETFLDPETMLPWRFEKKLREGGYKKDVLVKYDRRKDMAIYTNGDSVSIQPHVQDELSAFYYVRSLDLEVGKTLYVDSHSNRKNYPLEVIVHRKERVKVEAGEFDCFVIEPKVREGGIFSAKGTMTIYITDDEWRLPVLMKTKVAVGSVSVSLQDYTLGRSYARAAAGDPTVAME